MRIGLPIRLMLVTVLAVARAMAQNPAVADPQHFKVEYEDSQMRVLRFTLPAGEYTPMIDMADHTEVVLQGGHLLFYVESGKLARAGGLQDRKSATGAVHHLPGNYWSIKNIGASTWESVITELKPLTFAHASDPRPPPIELTKADAWGEKSAPVAPAQAVVPSPTQALPPKPEPQAQPQRSAEQAPQPTFQQPTTVEPTALSVDGAKVAFLNGTELAYIERGSGPQVVVLVHDTLGDYRSWAPQLTALARSYRVIAYSRRYHYPNHSNGKEHDYTYDINAKDLADFIRGLNSGPVRLVGFGYGASIAAMVAAEHPELVKALALTEPGFEKLLDTTGAYRSAFARDEIYGIIRKPLTKDKPEKAVQTYVDWLGYQSWAQLSTEEQFRRKQNANALHAQTLDSSAPNFSCSDAKKIGAPTLILSGQHRSPNSAEIAGVLSACIPNAERATVSNSGAAVYVENPAEADKLLTEFLAKQ